MPNDLTLYEAASEFSSVAEQLRSSDLDDQTITDTLEGLSMSVEDKARGVAFVAKDMRAMEVAIKDAENALQQRRMRIQARREWLEHYLLTNMQHCGIKRIEHPLMTIAVRDNPGAVIIEDETRIPWEYMTQPPTPPARAEKKLIADAIRSGKEVPGARLEITQRVEIKV